MRLCVVGMGYVGLTAAVAFAYMGHTVVGVESDPARLVAVRGGKVPFCEAGIETFLTRGLAAGRLAFCSRLGEAIAAAAADLIVVAINIPCEPPCGGTGRGEGSPLEGLIDGLAGALEGARTHGAGGAGTLVIKSTVPVGTGDLVEERLRSRTGRPWDVVSNPEFLREGTALHDFLHPDRVVIGAACQGAAEVVTSLYSRIEAPVLVTDRRTAELIKYASNAYLATRVSFINQVGDLCEKLGVDVTEVARGMGLDHRIGCRFLNAGLGYGGPCLPRDTADLGRLFARQGLRPSILDAVEAVNRTRRTRILELLDSRLGNPSDAVVAVWGLTFKSNTDDLRGSPALDIVPALLARGTKVRAYDPALGLDAASHFPGVVAAASPLDAAAGAHAVLVLTDWPEFANVDMARLRECMLRPVLVDGRSLLDPSRAARMGFEYSSLGRPPGGGTLGDLASRPGGGLDAR